MKVKTQTLTQLMDTVNCITVVGRIMTPPRCPHLNCHNYKYTTRHGQRDFVDMIQSMNHEMEKLP